MDYNATNKTAAMFLNVMLMALEIVAIVSMITVGNIGRFASFGFIANMLALAASLLYFLSDAFRHRDVNELTERDKPRRLTGEGSKKSDAAKYDEITRRSEERSDKIRVLRYLATVSLTVLFLAAIAAMTPLAVKSGVFREALWADAGKFFYFFCPVISYLSFVFLEPGPALDKKQVRLGAMIPIIFGAIYLIACLAGAELPAPFDAAGKTVSAVIFAAVILLSLPIAKFVSWRNEKKAE
jgi:hypothetical protein